MLGMKAAGVQSRSSWGRMIVSDAFSAILMGSVVNTLKRTTNVERPAVRTDTPFLPDIPPRHL